MLGPSTPMPVLLVGGLRIGAPEPGDYSFYGEFFSRLPREVPHAGELTRELVFECFSEEAPIMFLGIQVDAIENIPDGMMAWSLDERTLTVTDNREGTPSEWQQEVTWLWQSASPSPCNRGFTGEFRMTVPSEWTPGSAQMECEFLMTGHCYVAPGRAGSDDGVELVDYEESWPEQFNAFQDWLRADTFDDPSARIEHIGSTAITGMIAKPVIDVLVEVPSLQKAKPQVLPKLNDPKWEYWWYDNHMVFVKRDAFQGVRTHHVHIMEPGPEANARLAFRDYLAAHSEDAARYAKLKRQLADAHGSDREKYTDAKSTFINEIVSKTR